MVVPFAALPQHRNIVLRLYRVLIRNILHLPLSETIKNTTKGDIRLEILTKVQYSFRNGRDTVNSLQAQQQILQAKEVNDALVEAYEGKDSKLISLMPPKWIVKQKAVIEKTESPNINDQPTPILSRKTRKDPAYANLTDEEIIEFRNTRHLSLPQDTECVMRNIKVHAKWYFQSHGYPLLKTTTKLGKRYMKYILPSIITHARQKYALDKLQAKLLNPPSHKLRRVTGTGNWIYLINTPWNKDLRTEDLRFIGDVRKLHDELIIDLQSCKAYRNKYENLAHQESLWEKTCLNDKSTTDDWLWASNIADSLFQKQMANLESSVIEFNKRQGVIYSKIKPEFDRMHQHAVDNMKLLQKDISALQMGAYTDISDGGLGSLFRKYGFRDPMEKYKS